jgi:hypothetical protein
MQRLEAAIVPMEEKFREYAQQNRAIAENGEKLAKAVEKLYDLFR